MFFKFKTSKPLKIMRREWSFDFNIYLANAWIRYPASMLKHRIHVEHVENLTTNDWQIYYGKCDDGNKGCKELKIMIMITKTLYGNQTHPSEPSTGSLINWRNSAWFSWIILKRLGFCFPNSWSTGCNRKCLDWFKLTKKP